MLLAESTSDVAAWLDKGVIGVVAGGALYWLKVVAFRYAQVIENNYAGAQTELKAERDARQAHEKQIASILSEIASSLKGLKESMDEMKAKVAA